MKIQVDLSPLGPILLDVDEARELYRQLGDVFAGPAWLHRDAPGIARPSAHGQSTAGMPISEMRRLTGAVGE